MNYMSLNGQAAEICIAIGRKLGARGATELKRLVEDAETDGSQTISPRLIVAQFVWDEVVSKYEGWEFVKGIFSTQEHAWYELRIIDLDIDPLPMVWVIDPAPVKVLAPVVCLEPGCPFQLLYKRQGSAPR